LDGEGDRLAPSHLERKGFTAPGGGALRFEVEVPLSALGREAVGDEGGSSGEVGQVFSKEGEGGEAVVLLRPVQEVSGGGELWVRSGSEVP
jgi:hypothetical protein